MLLEPISGIPDVRILCDTTILDRPWTGVANALIHLYAACMKVAPDLDVEGLHRCRLQSALPAGMKDRRWGGSLPLKYWRPAVIPLRVWQCRPDFVHFHNNHWIPRLPKSALVVNTIHDTLPMRLPSSIIGSDSVERYRYRVQRDLDRTDLLITISEFSRSDILRYFKPRSEPIVIPLASTLVDQPPENVTQLNDMEDYFLYVGGYSPRKGLVQLLEVFLELTRLGKLKRKLVLVGQPEFISEHFSQLIRQGIEMRAVREAGRITDGQLRTVFSKAAALIYPSKYEGFGLPPLEAMSLGCPVVTTAETAIPEICGEAALYADPDDQAAFADALVRIQEDNSLRDDFRQKGLVRASQFCWEKAAGKFLNVLDEAKGERQKSRD